MKEEVVYLGVDVAKVYLDAAVGSEKRRLPNDAMGHRQLINWIKQIEAQVQVICEPSGGYERMLIRGLVGAQVKVSLVQANRVRQFARAAGILAKTDSGHGTPFYIGLENNVGSHLKVGQRVTLHYYVTGRGKLVADKIEKAGKSEKGSKKR